MCHEECECDFCPDKIHDKLKGYPYTIAENGAYNANVILHSGWKDGNRELHVEVKESGDIFFRNKKGELHRPDAPAAIWSDGSVEYYWNGKLDRDKGPAHISDDGTRKIWSKHGKHHRLDGPAIVEDDYQAWFVDGEQIECDNQEEFERILAMREFW